MRKRLISTVGLVALMLPAILFGGIFYYLVIGVFLVGAASEYVQLFNAVKFEPQMYITVGGVVLNYIHTHVPSEICPACF